MPSSSSTKRAARLAQKGKGKRVRFQGGTLFPMIILLILVVGIGTIVYARASIPAADASPPTIEDHWHMAYAFSLCDSPTEVTLQGNLEDQTSPHYQDYLRTYVHSHDDGVIHWHPFSGVAVGKRAKLGVFLENYGVTLTDTELKFPADQNGGKTYKEGETKCPDGKNGELSVTVWDSPQDTSDGHRYVTDFDDIRITKNSMVFTIAFQPTSVKIQMPASAPNLEQLGAVDTGQAPISSTTTTVPGATTVPGSTVAGATTVPGSTVAGAAPTTVPGSTPTTVPATTVAGAATATTATATTTG
jgi:hypothetical protein